MKVTQCVVIFMLAIAVGDANAAVAGFSRACRLFDIPVYTRSIVSTIFNQRVNGKRLDQLTQDELLYSWTFESITADYGYPRYWLQAQGELLTFDQDLRSGTITVWPPSPWIPGSAWDNNREWKMSVRSGQGTDFPGISDIWKIMPPGAGTRFIYGQKGAHAFYDSPTATGVTLPDSTATDCNCLQFGFGWTFLGMVAYGAMQPDLIMGALFLCNY
jgi:hypothetical protein